MASDSVTTTPDVDTGPRIWRFLAFNAVATTAGAIVFALTFEHTIVAVVLTFAALLTGFAVILREMLTLLGSDDDRLSHASEAPVAAPAAEPKRAVEPAARPVGAPLAH